MLPVPTIAELALFTGREESTFSAFATEALKQATLLFSVATKLTAAPADPDEALLAQYAILELADRIILEQPNAVILAGPFQSETIAGYSYSKGSTVAKVQKGRTTGLFWWDLAIDELRVAGASDVGYGSVHATIDGLAQDEDGVVFVKDPAEDDNGSVPYVRIS